MIQTTVTQCRRINVDDVYSAIRSLSVNKADSVDDLYSDNFKHATDLLNQYITLIINCMISHGIVPDSFLKGQYNADTKEQKSRFD